MDEPRALVEPTRLSPLDIAALHIGIADGRGAGRLGRFGWLVGRRARPLADPRLEALRQFAARRSGAGRRLPASRSPKPVPRLPSWRAAETCRSTHLASHHRKERPCARILLS